MRFSLAQVLKLSLRFCVSAVILSALTYAQRLPLAAPASVGMNAAKLDQIEQLVLADIADKKLPGAVVVVGHKGKIVYRKAFGNRSLVPTVEKMTVDTIFDVASLTKPVATATSVMILVEQGKLRLNDTIGKFIPEIDDAEAKKVTIQQLLTHTSGYRPDFDLGEKWTGREGMLAALKKEKLRAAPGTRFVYSDIGFIVLGEIIARVTGSPFHHLAESAVLRKVESKDYRYQKFFFSDLSQRSKDSGFCFNEEAGKKTPQPACPPVAPTESIRNQNNYLGSTFSGDDKSGDQILVGMVHDPTAFRMNGIAGHAGLFSTADDLARYCQMLLNGGVAPAVGVRNAERGTRNAESNPKSKIQNPKSGRVLSAQTIARMTAPYVVSEDGATRGLGWDMNTSFSSNRGELFPLGSFGHTGFTGTSIWIDPTSQTFVVFMSNRVHPDGKGDVTPLRAKVATVVASAIEDTPIEAYRLAESVYASQVAAQIPRFRDLVQKSNPKSADKIDWEEIAQFIRDSRKMTGLRYFEPIDKDESVGVLNGIDILEKTNFKDLEGKRIGLVTNHTGRNFAGKPTIDVLFEAKNVKLVSLFAPEHGIR